MTFVINIITHHAVFVINLFLSVVFSSVILVEDFPGKNISSLPESPVSGYLTTPV